MTNNHRELVARAMWDRHRKRYPNDSLIRGEFGADEDQWGFLYSRWKSYADAAIKAHLAALGLDEVRRGIIENGLNILATNSNGMTQTEWNDFSNAILAMLKASGEEHAG